MVAVFMASRGCNENSSSASKCGCAFAAAAAVDDDDDDAVDDDDDENAGGALRWLGVPNTMRDGLTDEFAERLRIKSTARTIITMPHPTAIPMIWIVDDDNELLAVFVLETSMLSLVRIDAEP